MGHVEILLHWGISKKNNTGTQTKNQQQKHIRKNKSTNYQYYQIIHILYTLKTIKNNKAHYQ